MYRIDGVGRAAVLTREWVSNVDQEWEWADGEQRHSTRPDSTRLR